ncbi:hypothetical protein GCM10010156_07420 [Planobispora rosea]|uniref:HTH arsR-type domain-containing protein n=1 Tax=Planobispora rosea TaxID=35762 RepID=A0A8J3WCI4_PLARO|nr:winged helix-turn-helix domain-containing protein [Planobispora rosea]GGS51343.1 hypothetical protein GCM10010156_07420 [Planobispora rosea]GIH82906.1 hypothetical protein Pro02_13140 [Planobispora rosea]
MALRVDLGVAELAATRFAISPLSETVAGLQQMGGRDRNPLNLRWLRWASDEFARRPLDLPRTWPLLVNDRPSWPEFLVPAPLGAGASIEDDLAALERTTAHQVRASLRRVFGEDLPDTAAALAARPAAGSTVRLLGRARAELLEALRSPATTTELARALGVTPSAVSQHLGVLRENGLVARERAGRNVLYTATALGVSLISPDLP